jgi:hypothetical protein
MPRHSIYLSNEADKLAKLLAEQQDYSFSELISRAIIEYAGYRGYRVIPTTIIGPDGEELKL